MVNTSCLFKWIRLVECEMKSEEIMDTEESRKFRMESDNMIDLIKAGHCVSPVITFMKLGPSLFKKEDKNE